MSRPTDQLSGAREVIQVAQGIFCDLDLEVVLGRLLESARELSGARYAAIGVLDPSRHELERFVTSGMDEETHRTIGALPRGRGVLGELIAHPRPLRVDDVSAHPHSFGFPAGHPPMRSFLGVPVCVAGQPWGNLYLTEKQGGGPFTDHDEEALELLAELAGVAIDHARRYGGVADQRAELERSVAALDATVQITRAVGGETDLQVVLELVAKRGRALVSARALVIEQQRGDELVVAAAVGEVPPDIAGKTVDLQDSVASAALRTGRTLRLEDEPNRARFLTHGVGRLGLGAEAGLVVPLVFRNQGHGVLIVVDRLQGGPAFTAEDQRLLEAFASSAATAVATARSVEAGRGALRLAAAEQERGRWARELHDETLQNLAALRLSIAAQLRAGDPAAMEATMKQAVDQIDAEIASLRGLIAELRPMALERLGIAAAIEDLAVRTRRAGLEVELRLDLGHAQHGEDSRRAGEVETALYRITQEALTNARKHGGARRAVIEGKDDEDTVRVSVRDDGRGFDPAAHVSGFGLAGMHERAELLGGSLEVKSAPGHGTVVRACIPRERAAAVPAPTARAG